MLSGRSDLELSRDGQARFLPWLIAFMVFLAALALAAVLALSATASRWDRGVSGTLTVHVPPSGDAERDRAILDAALTVLKSTPEIAAVDALGDDRLIALLEPWLGPIAPGDLPLPRLIDVRLKEDARLDIDLLAARLSGAAPGAMVDDHKAWLGRLLRLLRLAEAGAVGVLLLIVVATAGTVVFATRAGLAVHREAIEVLHMIGARDSYVARQFARRALALGFGGGVLGLALAAPLLAGLGLFAPRTEGALLPDLALGPWGWIALATLPVLAGLLAMWTARATVLRTLARMP